MTEWLAMLAVFLIVLAVGAFICDSYERRDARRRNGR
jgi:hypothetical protein